MHIFETELNFPLIQNGKWDCLRSLLTKFTLASKHHAAIGCYATRSDIATMQRILAYIDMPDLRIVNADHKVLFLRSNDLLL